MILGSLGPLEGPPGALLGLLWGLLGRLGAILGVLERSWAVLEASWALSGASWSPLGPSWGPVAFGKVMRGSPRVRRSAKQIGEFGAPAPRILESNSTEYREQRTLESLRTLRFVPRGTVAHVFS